MASVGKTIFVVKKKIDRAKKKSEVILTAGELPWVN